MVGNNMLTAYQKQQTLAFFHTLEKEHAGFSNTSDGLILPQPTLSVLKSYEFFGRSYEKPDELLIYIQGLFDQPTGGFKDPINQKVTVFSTAVALLALKQIAAFDYFKACSYSAMAFMHNYARIREEHFMLIGVCDECHLKFHPEKSIDFFKNQEDENGIFGDSVLNNAICASALLRIGGSLKNPNAVANLLLSAQTAEGGFADLQQNGLTKSTVKADLWTSYCVMRFLDLMHLRPNRLSLQSWILKLQKESGGFSGDDTESNANATYQCLSILEWISRPIIDAAISGDLETIKEWLELGGSADIQTLKGWTPLLAASARGQSEIVSYLLSPEKGIGANTKLRYENGDLSPLLLAGQFADLKTVQVLLENQGDLLFEISMVNGHNLLLQTAFFGSQKHLNVAKWLLENISTLLKHSPDDINSIESSLLKLTSMTNVRGFNCLTMAELWGNKPMAALFKQYDQSSKEDHKHYLDSLLEKIAPNVPSDPWELESMRLTNDFISLISDAFVKISNLNSDEPIKIAVLEEGEWLQLKDIIADPHFDINRLGGPLSQTPLIVALTGADTKPFVAEFRASLVHFLLKQGANPDTEELHPMGVDAVIRAAVLNHFRILKELSDYMKPLAFTAALNAVPPINGQTALQDTVHRALTATENQLTEHLEQIRWCIQKGARIDIEDHTGSSPEKLARSAVSDAIYAENAYFVMDALGI